VRRDLIHGLDVQLLATDPAYQRRGLASKLLKQVLDLADREATKAYIEATLAGYPVYERLGYKVVDIVEVDLSKWGGKGEPNFSKHYFFL
jgi:GNAT superfamily N-acetyltransferase